jgi:hypothetical protein
VLGDTSPGRGSQPGPPPASGEQAEDTEPTIDLSDELALVRVIQDVPPTPRPGDGRPAAGEVTEAEVSIAEVVQFHRVTRATPEEPPVEEPRVEESPVEEAPDEKAPDGATSIEETVEQQPADERPAVGPPDDEDSDDEGAAGEHHESGLDTLDGMFSDQDPQAEPPSELVVETMDEETVLEVAAPNGSVSDAVPSDASAVPELGPSLRSDAWEPAIVVDYPVEPSEDRSDGDVEVPEGSDDPGRPEPAVAADDRRDEAASLVDTVLFGETPTEAVTEPEEQLLPLDVPEQPAPANAPKAPRRKRASVPSWVEIVFGGPN